MTLKMTIRSNRGVLLISWQKKCQNNHFRTQVTSMKQLQLKCEDNGFMWKKKLIKCPEMK